MPVRTYNKKYNHYGLPHDLQYNGHDLQDLEEFDRLSKSLPFVDLDHALHHRILTRDPICGVGDLSPEINPLEGHKLRSKPRINSECTSPVRDPILLIGDLGGEYNCLYTTRDLQCKERDDRNIITLEGQLGEELDPIRPHGGKPRNFIPQKEQRNPITGVGEYRKEWDPIWKYEGRHIIKRPEQVKRDPITHSVPEENMGEGPHKTLIKHFNNQKDTDMITHHYDSEDGNNGSISGSGIRKYGIKQYRDPISHENKYGEMEEISWKPGTRHFNDRRNRDPITHESKYGEMEEISWKPGTRHFNDRRSENDPITHHGFSDSITEIKNKQNEARMKSLERTSRDPITGSGIIQTENKSLFKNANNYAFRTYLNPKTKSATTESKPQRATKKQS